MRIHTPVVIDGSQLTVTGKTLAENLADVEELSFDNQDVIRRFENPIKATGHLMILRGNLSPGSAVAKITGKEGSRFEVLYTIAGEMLCLLTANTRALRNASTREKLVPVCGFASKAISLSESMNFSRLLQTGRSKEEWS